MSHRIRVGVLRGGPSPEYEVSLASGASVLNALRNNYAEQYEPRDVFVDRKGVWHIDGVAINLADLSRKIDVAWNALHGTYGEDGKVQSILEIHGIPFTGSDSLASAIGMNKALAKKIFNDRGIKTPYWKEVRSEAIGREPNQIMKELFETLILPVVVKPTSGGSSVATSIVHTYQELSTALTSAATHGNSVIIEEYIPGVEATCGVIENFRDQELYALPPIEIRPTNAFFDYEAKYKGKSGEIVPATFSKKIKGEIEALSAKIHRALGLRHYSRSDFIIHPRRGIYALEVNTLPGLTEESLMPKALRAVGSNVHEFVGHMIGLAVR